MLRVRQFLQRPLHPPLVPSSPPGLLAVLGAPSATHCYAAPGAPSASSRYFTFSPHPFRPNMVIQHRRTFTPDDIHRFLELTGDENRLHRDPAACAAAGFSSNLLVPGMLVAALLPAAVTRQHPYAVYATQNLRFVRPAYAGEELVAYLEVNSVGGTKLRMGTRVLGPGGEVLTGKALLLLPQGPRSARDSAA